jgi:hypothetical protein
MLARLTAKISSCRVADRDFASQGALLVLCAFGAGACDACFTGQAVEPHSDLGGERNARLDIELRSVHGLWQRRRPQEGSA